METDVTDCHKSKTAGDGISKNEFPGELAARHSREDAADHGACACGKKNGSEPIDTRMKNSVCKERPIGPQV